MTVGVKSPEFALSAEVDEIRDRIGHPVVDADGHHLECLPLVKDFAKDIAGTSVADRLDEYVKGWLERSHHTPTAGYPSVRQFFTLPAENTLDRVTATLPELMYRRLDQFGIDFALLYPSVGLTVATLPVDELRQTAARALNTYYATVYADYRDRLEPVAIIPTFTPEEAIAELEYAIGTLGLKAVVMSATIPRSVGSEGTQRSWVDTLSHGSVHDYNPVWAKCAELGVAPAFHGGSKGWGSRSSTTNYVYNHLGHFATSQEAACRSLVIGGVPRRFPNLRFSFLEGGVAWSAQLFADLVGHWEKRNKDAVMTYDPHRLDIPLATELVNRFARGRLADVAERFLDELKVSANGPEPDPTTLDDFAESMIESAEDLFDIFTRQFHFGCEADDPLNALAFEGTMLPRGARLNAMFASDIGHWDVRDMSQVLLEAWELVEHGSITDADFREFACGNIVRMLKAGNPSFFDGTVIADAVSGI